MAWVAVYTACTPKKRDRCSEAKRDSPSGQPKLCMTRAGAKASQLLIELHEFPSCLLSSFTDFGLAAHILGTMHHCFEVIVADADVLSVSSSHWMESENELPVVNRSPYLIL